MTKSFTVVGAGPGLGTEVARRFAERGFDVCAIARDDSALESFRSAIAETAPNVRVFTQVADVTNTPRLREALDACANNTGVPHVVLCNTSMYVEGTPTAVDPAVFEQTWRVITLGLLTTLQRTAPGMARRGSGTFLMPGTGVAIRPYPPAASLGAAKAAARNLMLNAHEELKPKGVQAATITINGMIKAGTDFDPELISKRFLQVSERPVDQWQGEYEYPA